MPSIVVTKECLKQYAEEINIGDMVTVEVGTDLKKVRGMVVNKFPFICQVQYEMDNGKVDWTTPTWFDLYKRNVLSEEV